MRRKETVADYCTTRPLQVERVSIDPIHSPLRLRRADTSTLLLVYGVALLLAAAAGLLWGLMR